jgi:hypothetical protein
LTSTVVPLPTKPENALIISRHAQDNRKIKRVERKDGNEKSVQITKADQPRPVLLCSVPAVMLFAILSVTRLPQAGEMISEYQLDVNGLYERAERGNVCIPECFGPGGEIEELEAARKDPVSSLLRDGVVRFRMSKTILDCPTPSILVRLIHGTVQQCRPAGSILHHTHLTTQYDINRPLRPHPPPLKSPRFPPRPS